MKINTKKYNKNKTMYKTHEDDVVIGQVIDAKTNALWYVIKKGDDISMEKAEGIRIIPQIIDTGDVASITIQQTENIKKNV